jgi:hypothetical protein
LFNPLNPPIVTALHSFIVPPVVFDHTGVGVPNVTILPAEVPDPGKKPVIVVV